MLFEKVGLATLSMMVAFWYAILLGPEGFGIAAMFLATTLLVASVQNNIQNNPLLATKEEFSVAMAASLKGWMLISLLTGLLLYLVLIHYWGNDYALLIVICVLHIPISSVSKVLLSELLREQQYKTIALRSILGKLLGVVVGIALAFQGQVKLAILVQSLVDLSVQLIVMAIRSQCFSIKMFFRRFDAQERHLFYQLVREGLPSGLNVIDSGFKTRGVVILLGILIGPYASGVFSLAMKLVDVPRTMIGFGLTTWAIGKMRAASENKQALCSVYVSASYVSALILTPAYLGMLSVSFPLLNEFFGSEWNEAAYVTNWICIYYLLQSIQLLVPQLLVISQRTHKTVTATMLSTTMMLIGGYILVPLIGMNGIVLAMFISLIPMFYKQEKEIKEILGVSSLFMIKSTFSLLFASILMSIVVLIFNVIFQWVNLYILILIGALFYLLLLLLFYYFGLINKSSLKTAMDM